MKKWFMYDKDNVPYCIKHKKITWSVEKVPLESSYIIFDHGNIKFTVGFSTYCYKTYFPYWIDDYEQYYKEHCCYECIKTKHKSRMIDYLTMKVFSEIFLDLNHVKFVIFSVDKLGGYNFFLDYLLLKIEENDVTIEKLNELLNSLKGTKYSKDILKILKSHDKDLYLKVLRT